MMHSKPNIVYCDKQSNPILDIGNIIDLSVHRVVVTVISTLPPTLTSSSSFPSPPIRPSPSMAKDER